MLLLLLVGPNSLLIGVVRVNEAVLVGLEVDHVLDFDNLLVQEGKVNLVPQDVSHDHLGLVQGEHRGHGSDVLLHIDVEVAFLVNFQRVPPFRKFNIL